ncbi:uncharacterized protein CLUP02_08712 [Colletotrichum lupini]|uniref:Uncharacterized protein n=1 Tax=Colletotrichum lupini TaxID=145971 RepID=A0A9Q8STL2_9PEZI|nr:uncharacterized protein CLUP02_08712 [Colletotrichum lupini]UQC83218.1 hypothetical protein CLUP02_08712 [Colletotrichum lupini]
MTSAAGCSSAFWRRIHGTATERRKKIPAHFPSLPSPSVCVRVRVPGASFSYKATAVSLPYLLYRQSTFGVSSGYSPGCGFPIPLASSPDKRRNNKGDDILPPAAAILPPSVAAAATRPPVSGTYLASGLGGRGGRSHTWGRDIGRCWQNIIAQQQRQVRVKSQGQEALLVVHVKGQKAAARLVVPSSQAFARLTYYTCIRTIVTLDSRGLEFMFDNLESVCVSPSSRPCCASGPKSYPQPLAILAFSLAAIKSPWPYPETSNL